MFSTTLVRLIDESIIPALILVVTKIGGVLLVARLFNLPFELVTQGRLLPLPSVAFITRSDYLKANAYSNLIMFGVVALGFILVLVRAHWFHQTHIHPYLSNRLERLGLSGLVGETVDIYHQAVIWLLFTWFVVILMVFNSFSGLSYLAFTVVAFLVALNLTWLLIFDVEREIIIQRQVGEEGVRG